MASNMGAFAKTIIAAFLAMLFFVSVENTGVYAQEAPAPGPEVIPDSSSPGSLLMSLVYPAVVAMLSFAAVNAL
ncbi:hypothetical protein Mapa_008496 [Marchantia paleacea]|nr:hypothetical protein Mapa_008496 [Marchantia paleacea]